MCAVDASKTDTHVVGVCILILTGYLTEYPWVVPGWKLGRVTQRICGSSPKWSKPKYILLFLITESGSLVTNPRLFIGQILIHYVWFMCFQQESNTDQFLIYSHICIILYILYCIYNIYLFIIYTPMLSPLWVHPWGWCPICPTSGSADLGVVSGAEASPASPAPFRGFWCLGGHHKFPMGTEKLMGTFYEILSCLTGQTMILMGQWVILIDGTTSDSRNSLTLVATHAGKTPSFGRFQATYHVLFMLYVVLFFL